MKTATAKRMIDMIFETLAPRFQQLHQRLAALEQKAGIEPKSASPQHKEGDTVQMGGATWICKGANRWRRVEKTGA